MPTGGSVVFPGRAALGTRNADDEPAVALVYGIVRADDRGDRSPPSVRDPGRNAPAGAVTIAAFDIGWEYDGQRTTIGEPIAVPVAPGQTISLPNEGAVRHNFAVEAFGNVVVDMPFGETVAYTVPEDVEPGDYEFICTIAGHA